MSQNHNAYGGHKHYIGRFPVPEYLEYDTDALNLERILGIVQRADAPEDLPGELAYDIYQDIVQSACEQLIDDNKGNC